MKLGFSIDISCKHGYISAINLELIFVSFELWFIVCHLPIIYKLYKNGFRTLNPYGFEVYK